MQSCTAPSFPPYLGHLSTDLRAVLTVEPPRKFSCLLAPIELSLLQNPKQKKLRLPRGGGFHIPGGRVGVLLQVERISVVDGGCRCRDSRRRRPSKGNGYGSFSAAEIGRLPRGPARPLAPASAAARRPSASLRTDYRKMEKDRVSVLRDNDTKHRPYTVPMADL
jgi:hypothetical protein